MSARYPGHNPNPFASAELGGMDLPADEVDSMFADIVAGFDAAPVDPVPRWSVLEDAPDPAPGDTTEPPTPRDIRAYTPKIHGQQVHYIRKDDATYAGQSGTASFVDKGRESDIHDWRNKDCVLAALQLSAQKWGSFQVKGDRKDSFVNE